MSHAEADSGSNAGRFAKPAAAELIIWNNLLEVARRAAELNARNGYRVNQHLAHVDRASVANAKAS